MKFTHAHNELTIFEMGKTMNVVAEIQTQHIQWDIRQEQSMLTILYKFQKILFFAQMFHFLYRFWYKPGLSPLIA